jgi:hypothetical protein
MAVLKVTEDAISFDGALDPEFNQFIGHEFTEMRNRIRTFMRAQCRAMDLLRESAMKGDKTAMTQLLLKEKSRAALRQAIRAGRSGLEGHFNALGKK